MVSKLHWDTSFSTEHILSVLQKKENFTKEEQRLKNTVLIKMLNFIGWYELLDLFEIETIKSEFLRDEIIHGVFPRSLRKKYEFIKRTLSEPV